MSEGPRVLSCGCIYDPTPMPDGSTYSVFVQGEHRMIADEFSRLQTPANIEAFREQSDAHKKEIDSWEKK